jgi:hypothetical protein
VATPSIAAEKANPADANVANGFMISPFAIEVRMPWLY